MGMETFFNPYKGDPRIPHGPEEVFSTVLWATNIATTILHLSSCLGYRPFRINKDSAKTCFEEASVFSKLRQGLPPVWPYLAPKFDAVSVPALWWKEAQYNSWKTERQGCALDSV